MTNEVCLNWTLFEQNFKESLKELRHDQDYLDVTLACEGDFQVDAHKIILSMGSNFFSEIFKKSKNKIAFVFLKGINQTQLKNLMNFLYNGEAKMERDDLNDFFKISKELQIKGLENYQEESEEKIDAVSRDPSILEEIEALEDELITSSDTTDAEKFAFTHDLVTLEDGSFFGKSDATYQKNMIFKDEQLLSDNADIDPYVEAHLPGDTFTCHICRKQSVSKKGLKVHIINYHSQHTFDCQNCGKSGMKKIIFKNHKRICKDPGLDKKM